MAISVRSRANNTSAGTSHNVSLPAGYQPGDLLLAIVTGDDLGITFGNVTGWQMITTTTGTHACYWRVATGTEGASFTVTVSPASTVVAVAFAVDGHDGNGPQLSTVVNASGDPDPPALNLGSAAERLWIAYAAWITGANVVSYPSGFTNGQQVNAGSTVRVGTAERVDTVGSLDPGIFDLSASSAHVAQTIAVTAPETVPVGLATEIGEAAAATARKTVPVGRTIEVGEARALASQDTIAIDRAQGTDEARAITPTQRLGFAPKASYFVEAQWDQTLITGYAQLNESVLNGADVLAPSAYVQQFNGQYDDLSSFVERITITRGRPDNLGPMQMSTCTIELRDPTGLYNPKNPSSPLAAAGLLVPGVLVRVRARYATQEYPRFLGFVRTIEHEPGPRRGVTVIECVDLFVRLQQVKPVIPGAGQTTTGAAIGRILDQVGWTDPALRSLAVGDTLPDFRADGSRTALELIEELLVAEQGVFFISRAGVATYLDRHAIQTALTVSTVPAEMRAIAPGTDLDRVRNRARVLRRDFDTGEEVGQPQTAEDADSIRRYGPADVEEISTVYLASDNQAQDLARWLVLNARDPRSPIYALALRNTTPELLLEMLERELEQVVEVTVAVGGGTQGEFVVERIEETILATGRHTANWVLSERPGERPFVVGVSELDGPHVLTY